MAKKNKLIIISLGGSIIVPNELDIDFLKNFQSLIRKEINKGKKFIIITGGGYINRKYINAAKLLSNTTEEDLDWIGIAALKLNAELMRVILKPESHEEIICNFHKKIESEKPVIIGAAYKPGRSTDWDAVLAAQTFRAKEIVNLSNIDYAYDSDPKLNPNAKRIEKISWKEYRKIIPKEWISRLSTPFDPIASEFAEKNKLKVIIMNGTKLKNLENYLNGDKFNGTTIE